MASQAHPLEPTYIGHISSTKDALILFEACLQGILNHVPRRPHDRERQDLIRSGYVFIYEEHSSGIKRWTDGVSWSPSRILNNFLIYRELNKPFPPGEKKRALKRPQKKPSNAGITKGNSPPQSDLSSAAFSNSSGNQVNGKDPERALIGSLVDSYPFKIGGLIKKTISISYRGVSHHLVSYYSIEEAQSHTLSRPTDDPLFRNVMPRPEICTSQNFRAPLEEIELTAEAMAYGVQGYLTHGPLPNHPFDGSMVGHPMNPMSYPPRPPHYAAVAPIPAPVAQVPMQMQPVTPTYETRPPPFETQPSPLDPPHAQMYSFPSSFHSYAMEEELGTPLHQSTVTGQSSPPHYHLDGGARGRFASTAGIINQSPRHMPSQDMPRRHSTFESGPSTDLDGFSLSSMPEGRGSALNSYAPNNSFMDAHTNGVMGHGPTFPSPPSSGGHPGIAIPHHPKEEPDMGNSVPGSQSYVMDSWNPLTSLDETQEDFQPQYFKGGFHHGDHYSESQ